MSDKSKKNSGIEPNEIGKVDSMAFSSAQCTYSHSDCDGILLTPEDMYNISRKLQLTPTEVYEEYCWGAIDEHSCVPMVFLKTSHMCRSVKRCPFLYNGQCIICESKPSICTFPPIEKQMKTRHHTISERLMVNGTRYKNDFINRWQSDIAELGKLFYILDRVMDYESMEPVWGEGYVEFYFRYDMKKDFMDQYEENVQFLAGFLQWELSECGVPFEEIC